LSATPATGQNVPDQVLNEVATKFMKGNFPGGARKISSVIPIYYDDHITLNLFELNPEGWILLSSDLKVEPVIGFSFTGHFTLPVNNSNDAMYNWFNLYQQQIKQIITDASFKSQNAWQKIQEPVVKRSSVSSIKVTPFINATWDQGKNWNQFCPVDAAGPGGHVYAGCVAVCMAQAMSVFKTPGKGQGYNNYLDAVYGNQYANFGNTYYYWDSISDTKADQFNSLLLYHCAVAVNMKFGADGSGTQTSYTSSALRNYFSFSQKIVYKQRSGTDKEWYNLLIDQLLHGRPIIYAGDANDGQPGHAFNIDGVNDNGYSCYFHINWGWSGTNNGYYTLNALNPGSFNFNKNQAAVFGIQPFYFPTDITISDSLVSENMPEGTFIGRVNVIDEATDNSYIFNLLCDSVYNGTNWERNYYMIGDSLKTGRVFTAADKRTDTISVLLKDRYNNSLTKKITLNLTGSLTGYTLQQKDGNDYFTLYPNPAAERIFISQNERFNIRLVRIYSLAGKLILEIDKPDTGHGIPIRFLKPGLYILEAELDNHNLIYKRFIRN
jgi:hypothetical protein